MTRTVPALALAVALVSLAPLQAAGMRFRPGLWEVTTSSEGAHARSATTRRCYTAEQVKVANGSTAEVIAATRANEATLALQKKGCRVREVRLVGDQISEIIECPAFLLEDVTIYRPPDRFESDTTTTPKQGPPRKIHKEARRVGDCR